MTFPVAVEMVMVPEFDELVIAAADSFPELELVDPEEISVRVLHEWDRGDKAPQPFGSMGPSDLGLRLYYFGGEYKDCVLKLKDGSKPVVGFRA